MYIDYWKHILYVYVCVYVWERVYNAVTHVLFVTKRSYNVIRDSRNI